MTNNNNPVIPAKRYFTLDEMCQLLQISPAQFAQWQHENNVVIGYGGDRYTRSDVVKLLKLKDTSIRSAVALWMQTAILPPMQKKSVMV